MRTDRERPSVKVDFRAAELFPLTAFTFEFRSHLRNRDCCRLALMKYVIKLELVALLACSRRTRSERRACSGFN